MTAVHEGAVRVVGLYGEEGGGGRRRERERREGRREGEGEKYIENRRRGELYCAS